MHISIISFVLTTITISYVSAKAKVTVKTNTVTFNDCFAPDLRNIKDFHKSPQTIHISHCQLPELPNSIFMNLAKLKSLEICESKLSHIQVRLLTHENKRRNYIIKLFAKVTGKISV